MAPPVPAECDYCHRPLDEPLICSRCKGFAFCSTECQAGLWSVHKAGCSPLPSGELVPAEVAVSSELCAQAKRIEELLVETAFRWTESGLLVGDLARNLSSVPQNPQPALSQVQRHSLLLTPQLARLAAHPIPPAYDLASYPGRPKPHTNNLRHRLVLLTRLVLLHTILHMDARQARRFLVLQDPASHRHADALREMVNGGAVPFAPGARLHGPKVLAVPGGLSAAEYESVAPWMLPWCASLGIQSKSMAWVSLEQMAQQAAICPEMLEYVPE